MMPLSSSNSVQKTAKQFYCHDSGICAFQETARFRSKYRVNLGYIDDIDSVNLPFDLFDGRHLL